MKSYQVDVEPLGIGWFGTAYLAKDTSTQKTVVVKELKNINMGKNEAKAMKGYGTHKFLPKFYDFFIIEEKCYIVMEYCPGEKLGKGDVGIHNRKRRPKEAILITLNILKGLKHLHSHNYKHNDIVPKNIIVNKTPNELKLIDFGFAKEVKVNDKDSHFFDNDLYNTALICLYLITGFVSDSPLSDLINSSIEDDMLKEVIYKGINPTIEQRYYTSQDFIDSLQPLL